MPHSGGRSPADLLRSMRPTIDPHRHSQRWLLWLAAAALAWCLTLSVSGGFDTRLLGHAFTAHDVVRPLDAAAVLLALHLWLTRRQGSVDGPASSLALPAFSAWGASVVLAVLVGAVGVIHGVRTASTSDAYGYPIIPSMSRRPWRTRTMRISGSATV